MGTCTGCNLITTHSSYTQPSLIRFSNQVFVCSAMSSASGRPVPLPSLDTLHVHHTRLPNVPQIPETVITQTDILREIFKHYTHAIKLV